MFVCLSVCLSVCPSVRPSVFFFVFLLFWFVCCSGLFVVLVCLLFWFVCCFGLFVVLVCLLFWFVLVCLFVGAAGDSAAAGIPLLTVLVLGLLALLMGALVLSCW